MVKDVQNLIRTPARLQQQVVCDQAISKHTINGPPVVNAIALLFLIIFALLSMHLLIRIALP